MVKPTRPMVILGAATLLLLQASIVYELFGKAREQHWHHFWIDLAVLYGLAMATGVIVAELVRGKKVV